MGETKDHKYCWNLFLVIGITLLLYPEIISYLKQKQSDQTVKELTQRRSKKNRMIYCIKKQSAITGRYSKKNKQD